MLPIRVAISSAASTDIHIPVVLKRRGRSNTAPLSNTIVRKNDIIAEVKPSLSAVKKPEEKMLSPIKPNAIEKIRNAETVNFINSLSYPTNTDARGDASNSAKMTIPIPASPIIDRLFRRSPFSSELFFAP